MTKIELLQAIGNEVCEGCGSDADCGELVTTCVRIQRAWSTLNEWLDIQDELDVPG